MATERHSFDTRNQNIPDWAFAGLAIVVGWAATFTFFDFLDDREVNGSVFPGRPSSGEDIETGTQLIPSIPKNTITIINMAEEGLTLEDVVDKWGGSDHVDVIVLDPDLFEEMLEHFDGTEKTPSSNALALIERIQDLHTKGLRVVLDNVEAEDVIIVDIPSTMVN